MIHVDRSLMQCFRASWMFLLACLSLVWACSSAEPSRTVRVGFYENSPKIYTEQDGERTGFFVDILTEIALQEGWDIEYVDCDWDRCLSLLRQGSIDLMPDVAFVADRNKLFDFHVVSVVSSWSQIYRAPNETIEQLSDLHNKRLAFLAGAVQVEHLTSLMETENYSFTPLTFPSFDAAFAAVADGKADAVVTNNFYALRNASRFKVVETPILFQPINLFFATPKGKNADLLATIDQYLGDWKHDPDSFIYQTLRRYVVEPGPNNLPVWAIQAAEAVAGLVVVLLLLSVALRAQVKRKTQKLQLITQELVAERQNLERQVEARTAELKVAKETAEGLTQIKTDFISSMNHEIRNPLNAVIGFISLANNDDLPRKTRDYLRKANQAAEGLLRIINDVLDMSRIESGKLSLDIVSFNLCDVLQQTADVSTAGEKHGSIKFSIEHELALPQGYMGDPYRLQQILLNLIGNAFKFTSQGEIRLNVLQKFRRDEGVVLEFRLSDTGIGMLVERQSELFQKFTQADQSTARKYGGSGLGLAICRELVQLMGGEIWIERTAPGEGTEIRFTIKLLIAPDLERTWRDRLVETTRKLGGRTATVISDDRTEAITLCALLAECGVKASPTIIELGSDAQKVFPLVSAPDLAVITLDPSALDALSDAVVKQDKASLFIHAVFLHRFQTRNHIAQDAIPTAVHIVQPITPVGIIEAALEALQLGNEDIDAGKAEMPGAAAAATQGLRILLVDDNELNREVGKGLLTRRGVTVDLAENGKVACDLAFKTKYDAILMDLQMPELDGFGALAAIQRYSKEPSKQYLAVTPVIAMTASASPGDIQRSMDAGFSAHLAKPLRTEELMELLDRLING